MAYDDLRTGLDGRSYRRGSDEKAAECKWKECTNPVAAHGLCRTHYAKARYSEEWEHLIPPHGRASRCWVPDCERPAYAKELCRAHWMYTRSHSVNDIDKAFLAQRRARQQKARAANLNRQRLSVLKALHGSSLEDMGSIVGYTREAIRQWLNGGVRSVDKEKLRTLAEHYGVSLEWLTNPSPLRLHQLKEDDDG